MKKFIVLSLLLFLTFAAGRACCYVPTTNYYIYKVVSDLNCLRNPSSFKVEGEGLSKY